MHPSENFIPLIFHQGNHGNWFLWCLEYFGNPKYKDLPNPFNTTGAAHNHIFAKENIVGQGYINNYYAWRSFLRAPAHSRNSNIVMMHPPIVNHIEYNNFVACITEDCNKSIVIAYDPTNVVDQLDCAYERANSVVNGRNQIVMGEFWLKVLDNIIQRRDHFNSAYNIELPFVDDPMITKIEKIKSLDRWIFRELLSTVDLISYSNLLHAGTTVPNSQAFSLTVKQLYSKFDSIIPRCIDYLGYPYQLQNADQLSIMHNAWLDKQPHKDKDNLINNIVDKIDTTEDLAWAPLTVVDESIIQHKLTARGFQLEVCNLNVFPNNLTDLRKLCK